MEKKEELYSIFNKLDEQHKNILSVINVINEACINKESRDRVIELIYSLDKYVMEHFKDEEYLAEELDFFKTEYLKDEHDYFKGIYYKLCSHYNYDKNDKSNTYYSLFSVYLVQTMLDWLDFHIKTIDKDLMEFVKSELAI